MIPIGVMPMAWPYWGYYGWPWWFFWSWLWWGRGRGWCRFILLPLLAQYFFGYWAPPVPWGYLPYRPPASEREYLERERDYLRRQLEEIERRLRELEGS